MVRAMRLASRVSRSNVSIQTYTPSLLPRRTPANPWEHHHPWIVWKRTKYSCTTLWWWQTSDSAWRFMDTPYALWEERKQGDRRLDHEEQILKKYRRCALCWWWCFNQRPLNKRCPERWRHLNQYVPKAGEGLVPLLLFFVFSSIVQWRDTRYETVIVMKATLVKNIF